MYRWWNRPIEDLGRSSKKEEKKTCQWIIDFFPSFFRFPSPFHSGSFSLLPEWKNRLDWSSKNIGLTNPTDLDHFLWKFHRHFFFVSSWIKRSTISSLFFFATWPNRSITGRQDFQTTIYDEHLRRWRTITMSSCKSSTRRNLVFILTLKIRNGIEWSKYSFSSLRSFEIKFRSSFSHRVSAKQVSIMASSLSFWNSSPGVFWPTQSSRYEDTLRRTSERNEIFQVLNQTFPSHTFLMNGIIHGIK